MKINRSYIKYILVFILLGVCFGEMNAQCPSCLRNKREASFYLSVYGMPYGHYFPKEGKEFQGGITGGAGLGLLFSDNFHLQFGTEYNVVDRDIEWEIDGVLDIYEYKTMFIEIPMEARIRIASTIDNYNQMYVMAGIGIVLSRSKLSTDPNVDYENMTYEQFFVRFGIEDAISVDRMFNFIWGLLIKVDPMAVVGSNTTALNGAYYFGAKMGIQLGF